MGTIATEFSSAFRDSEIDGMPASGPHEPVKSEIRAIGPIIESALAALSLGSVSVTKTTRALLNADLAHAVDTTAIVYADVTNANNDIYIKVGASGTGSWTLTTILHDSAEAIGMPWSDLAQAWAEGTLPGGVGTKSAKEHAEAAALSAGEASLDAASAALSAAVVESFSVPSYASTALGLAATAVGVHFAVDNGDGTVTMWLHDVGDVATQPRTLATTVALADATGVNSGDSLIGSDDGASGTLWTTVKGFITYLRSSVGSSIVGFIQAGTGAILRTMQSKIRAIVNPEDYGAIGDGANDDGPAFQRAINYISSIGGGMVALTSGKNYCVDTQVNVCDNLIVSGYGAKITAGTSWAHIDAPMFKNFTGALVTTTSGTSTASSSVSFYGVEFFGNDSGGASGVANANMHGFMICLGSRGISAPLNGVIIRDCYFSNFNGCAVQAYSGSNWELTGNRFFNIFVNTALSIGSGIQFSDVDGFIISNNIFDHTSTNWSWHGMTIVDSSTGSINGVISDNVIRNMNRGDGISCEGNTLDNLDNVTISANSIYNCWGDGIGVDNCVQVVVDANTIKTVGGRGIACGQTQILTITGNTIRGCYGSAIQGSADKATITGNLITSVSYLNASFQGEGIFLNPTAISATNSVLIVGNYIKDTDSSGVNLTQGGVIADNFIYNSGISASSTRRNSISANSTSTIVDNIIVSTGNTVYGIRIDDNPPNMRGNSFSGTFTGSAYAYIGYRNNVATNILLTMKKFESDADTDTVIMWDTSVPGSGYWLQGDMVYYTNPAAAGFIGQVCVATPSTWKTWGAITA